MVAGAYGAHVIGAVDRRITNRNLLVMGGFAPTEPALCQPAEGGAGAHEVRGAHASKDCARATFTEPEGGAAEGRHERRVRDWHGREPARRKLAQREAEAAAAAPHRGNGEM